MKKRYHFNSKENYYAAQRKLSAANYYRGGNGNPPSGDEAGLYRRNDAWLFIDIVSGDIELEGGKLELVKPTKYVVIDQGGYLD